MKRVILFAMALCLMGNFGGVGSGILGGDGMGGVHRASAEDMHFVWDANTETDLDGYWLYKRLGGEEYDYNMPLAECTAASTTCDEVVLPDDGLTYCFVLRAFDTAANVSSDSNECCYTTTYIDIEPPDPPNGFGCTGE